MRRGRAVRTFSKKKISAHEQEDIDMMNLFELDISYVVHIDKYTESVIYFFYYTRVIIEIRQKRKQKKKSKSRGLLSKYGRMHFMLVQIRMCNFARKSNCISHSGID